jgi:hypothetical protein
MALPGMDPKPMDGPAPGMDADAPKPGASPMAKAFRVLRHALADGDDEAGGEALADAMRIHSSSEDEPDGDEGDDMAPKKPNLALILASKGKKD